MNAYLERSAVLSDCGRYRYLLSRMWDFRKPRVLFVMLNPSTADAMIDDATIRSCVRLARSFEQGSLQVVNLFALRATDPIELTRAADPIGPKNDSSIEVAITRCNFVICAWGAHPTAARRSIPVFNLLRHHHSAVFCLGITKTGAPKHPLYIKSGTRPQPFGV